MASARETLLRLHADDAADSRLAADSTRADGHPSEISRQVKVAPQPILDNPADIGDTPEPRLMLPRIRIDAFVQGDELAQVVSRAAGDRRAVRSEFAIHRGGFSAAIERYREVPAANLILIEDSGSADQLEWHIEALAECCPPNARLVVIGTRNDISVYRRLTKLGVSDYLVQPIGPLHLLDSILSIFAESDEKELGLVLAFVGTRGGSGASTVAHNVASTLSRTFEATTLLIDADLGFGTAALQFDITSPQGFADAVRERENLDRDLLERLVHWRDKRLGVLAAPDKLDQLAAPDPGIMRHLVDQARRLAQFVVLDLPHGWSPWIAEALASADRVGIVATADLPSLRNSRTLLEMIQMMRPNDAPPELILNRIPLRGKPQVSVDDYVRILGIRRPVTIPFDATAASAEMSGHLLVETSPSSEAAAAIASLVSQMADLDKNSRGKAAPEGLLGRLLGRKRR